MSQVSIIEAARLAGRDRKSIYRAIHEGRLSATTSETGTKQVDTAELERVYGKLRPNRNSGATKETPHGETVETTVRLAVCEALLIEKDKLLVEKDRVIDGLENTVRLLEHKPQNPLVMPVLQKASPPVWLVALLLLAVGLAAALAFGVRI